MNGISNQTELTAASVDKSGSLRTAWQKSYSGLVSVGVFSVFINILKLATPLYILQLLDRVIASQSIETLVMLSIITLIAIICGVLLEVVRRRMLIHWGNWIERRFSPVLFAASLKKNNQKYFSSSKTLRDIATIRSFVSGQGIIAWMDLIWAPIFIASVYFIEPILAYIVIAGSVIALLLGAGNELITRDSRNAAHTEGKGDRELLSSAERNRETIGSLDMVNSFIQHWSRSAFARIDESSRTRTSNVYFSSTLRLVGSFVRIGIFATGIWLVITQVLTLGSVVAANILGRIAYSLVQSAMLRWREMLLTKRAYKHIKRALLKRSATNVSRLSVTEPQHLILEKASYRYPGQAKSIIRSMQLTVAPGDFLCVVGSSASGKTTFSRLISGLIAPRSGKIRLGDIDVYRLQQEGTHREIGYLPQDICLFQGTVRENIAGMESGDINLVVEAAKLAGIHQVIINMPDGYDTEIVDKEPLLSAGQRKCIALARAFYGEPPLIIMDEPMPHLDLPSRKILMTSLRQLKRNGSIIILTTQMKTLSKNADIIIIHDPKKGLTLKSQKIKSHIKKDDVITSTENTVLVKDKEKSSRTAKSKSKKKRLDDVHNKLRSV